MQKFILILLTVVFFYQLPALARPLGTIPEIQEQDLLMLFDFRSDLWTSPYTYKDSPVRITSGEVRVPLYAGDSWAMSAAAYTESLNLGRTDFELGTKDIFIGNSLRQEYIGIGARKTFDSGASISGFLASATASDDPWGSGKDKYTYAAVIYRSRMIDDHNWIFGVDQSQNRGIKNGQPFPYLGITYHLQNDMIVSFGFPFFRMVWKFAEDWVGSASVTPFGMRVAADRKINSNTSVGALAALSVRSYLFHEREEDADRLFYQEIMGEVFLARDLTEATRVIFALGGAADRKLYESERVYEPNSQVTTIKSDFYGRLAVEFRL
ncbi:hypothetical protein ACLVWU_00535 [Bdellovibrio sp. HCB290]|uniref:hypothetical protein n=1 Tax=Bdellovibrio sp. HCB290 TaxID=3394356 RepID=UPI0039B60B7A